MGFWDKLRNNRKKAEGKGQEFVGRVRGNREQEARGEALQDEAGLRQAGEKVKDAGAEVKDVFKK